MIMRYKFYYQMFSLALWKLNYKNLVHITLYRHAINVIIEKVQGHNIFQLYLRHFISKTVN